MSMLFGIPILFLILAAWPVAVAGHYASAKRMGFYVDAVAHSALAVFSIFMVLSVLLEQLSTSMAIWFSILGVGGMGAWLSTRLLHVGSSQGYPRQNSLRGEPWMGEIFVLSLAASSIVLSKVPLAGIDFGRLFLGQFLWVKPLDLHILITFNILFLLAFIFWGRRWHVFFWDPFLYRHIYGRSRIALWILFFLMTSLVGFLVQSVGVIYAFALMIFPGRTAHMLASSMPKGFVLTALLVCVMGMLGLWLSYVFDIPSGPACAVFLVLADMGGKILIAIRPQIK